MKRGESYVRSITVDIPEGLFGNYYIIVNANDLKQINENSLNNNYLASSVINITDTEPPTVQITSGPSDGKLINTDTVEFSWEGSDNSSESLTYAASVSTSSTFEPENFTDAKAFNFELTSGDGTYFFKVLGKDAAGNISSPASTQFKLDTQPPTVTNISLAETQNQPFDSFPGKHL